MLNFTPSREAYGMNRTTNCERLIETDSYEWSELSLHRWIMEIKRVLKLVDESGTNEELDWIRSQLEGELQEMRQSLATIH